jgi:large subunit ribosomal protein L17
MRHRVKKIKIKFGKDANKMLARKLLVNFLKRGKIVTTLKKAKVLKSLLERIVSKSKIKSEANKNYLLRYINDKKTINFLFDTIGPLFKDLVGGYVKIIRIGSREGDAAPKAQLEWTRPVVIENKLKEKEEKVKKSVKKINP